MSAKTNTAPNDAPNEKLPKGFWIGLWILIAAFLVSGIVVSIVSGSREDSPEVATIRSAPASTEPAAQKFALEVGKPILTAWITETSYYRIHSNHEFIALSRLESGGYERIRMPAGWSNWAGRARTSFVAGTVKEGNLACEGITPGTELTFFGK
jgi:hypothetical protein